MKNNCNIPTIPRTVTNFCDKSPAETIQDKADNTTLTDMALLHEYP